jgi:hypothetical protein
MTNERMPTLLKTRKESRVSAEISQLIEEPEAEQTTLYHSPETPF